ncbi:MAG TPA: EcsC family protein [Bryobacteraceae bacterium]|nr:EcsC family protein [Bryobacteraceae bacterium]
MLPQTTNDMTKGDLDALQVAVKRLECTAFLMKLAGAVGAPIESLVQSLPEKARNVVQDATRRTLERCLDIAITSLRKQRRGIRPLDVLHKASCAASGALGGFFGVYALPLELPFSTAIMLRSIAEIAQSEGESLGDIDARLACISVLAFGARTKKDDDAELGYFAVRTTLATTLPKAADRALPTALARFLTVIAERFGITVSEKVVAEAVPIVGALGGGAVNLVFINHFQDMAHGHFTVRRLERTYGEQRVREEYDRVRGGLKS